MANNNNANRNYDYPLSPWAQRFGQSPERVWSGVNGQDHSGLAPMFRDPAGSGQQPYPVPSLEELDLLFLSEAEQDLQLSGFRTWELAVLNETLYGDFAGGHRRLGDAQDEERSARAFDQGRLIIDEDKWLPWLRRDNWWQSKIVDDRRTLPGRKFWSVDDDCGGPPEKE
ncbi:hypothetical protein PG994_013561 [Apiospora phragmitis]|uniref:Uncharacterized protein n=1 Tax=Apiospora phragmitis TaxID=2905665 RepID=A0ABR1T8Z8_9PEZI